MILLRSLGLTLFLIAATQVSGQVDLPGDEKNHFRHEENVKVTFDPHVVLTKRILVQLAYSPAVQHQSIRDINGKTLEARLADERHLLLGDERLSAGDDFGLDNEHQLVLAEGSAFGTLYAFISRMELPPDVLKHTRNSDAEYQALVKRYHEAVRKRFEESLDAIAKREFEKHLRREARSVVQERELADAALARVREKREVLRKTSAGLPQSVLEDSVSNLQKQQQALELDAAGLKARAEAIQEQIKKATEDLKKAAPDEAVQKHLERVLQVRTDQLRRLREMHAEGTIPATGLAKAEEEVALAQVNLAQARREAGKGISDRIEKLNAELAQIAVARSEAQAKAEYVEKHLAKAGHDLQTEINSAQPLRDEISAEAAAAQAMAIEARKREAELRRLEASYRPASVEVFDVKTTDVKTTEEKGADKEKKGR